MAQNPYNPFTGAQVQTVSSTGPFSSSNTFQTTNNSIQSGGIFGSSTQSQSLFGQNNTSIFAQNGQQGSIFSQPGSTNFTLSGQQTTFSQSPFSGQSGFSGQNSGFNFSGISQNVTMGEAGPLFGSGQSQDSFPSGMQMETTNTQGVTQEPQHEPWMLEAYASTKFQNGRIPEIPPTANML